MRFFFGDIFLCVKYFVCNKQKKSLQKLTGLKMMKAKSVDEVHGPGLTGEWVQIISH